MKTTIERPPVVVGYEYHPFIRYEDDPPRKFYCPMDVGTLDVWPSRMEPIWRGEVPEDAECHECGIKLSELE